MEFSEVETLLADKPEALAFVKGLNDRAALVTDDVKADLGRLPELRKHSEVVSKLLGDLKSKDPESLLTDIANIRSVKADLEKQKKDWKEGGKPTDSAEYRALEEQLNEVKGTLKSLQDESTQAKDEAARARKEKAETDLKSSVTTAAGKLKATEPDDIFILAAAKGLVGHKEDGTPFFNKLNDKGEKVAVKSAEEMVTWLSTSRKDLFMGSGVAGVGGDHRGTEPGEEKMTPQQARSGFLALRGKK